MFLHFLYLFILPILDTKWGCDGDRNCSVEDGDWMGWGKHYGMRWR